MKQRAEIASYFGSYIDAEKIYLEIDRKDLALELRSKLGDWFRVVQLIKSGEIVDDKVCKMAYNSVGDFYFDRQKW
jgi:WD repeat-containing protein 35